MATPLPTFVFGQARCQFRDYAHFDSAAFPDSLFNELNENYVKILNNKKYIYNDFITVFKSTLDKHASFFFFV